MVKVKAFSRSIKCCFREVTHGKQKYKEAPFNTMYFLSVLAVHKCMVESVCLSSRKQIALTKNSDDIIWNAL